MFSQVNQPINIFYGYRLIIIVGILMIILLTALVYVHFAGLDDTYFYLIIALLICLISVTLYYLFGVFKILDRNVAELNFMAFAMDQHAIVSTTDVKGNITYANSLFCDISGYTKEELIGKNHRIIKSDEHSPEIFKEMWRTVANGKVWNGDVKNYSKDGRDYWVNATIVPFMDNNNKPFKYLSIRTDISNLKKREEQLLIARDKAEVASQAKSNFLAQMSHEIRTPMNAIIGFTELSMQATDKNSDYLKTVYDSSHHLLRLINNILDLSKVEAGELEIDCIIFDLCQLLNELNATAKLLARNKNIILDLCIHTEEKHTLTEFLLKGDPLRLNQILTNLISNAIKFTQQGKVSLYIKKIEQQPLQESSQPRLSDLKLQFVIQDTGIGINPEQQQKLFKNFSQLDSNITRTYGGTGLGLAISKQLIEQMGGQINVKSEFGKGSQFDFSLAFPLPTSEEVGYYKKANKIQPDVGPKSQSQNINILLVEDNKVNQVLAQTLLEDSGYQVDIADNGQQAIEKLEQKKYTCVLMDINMPIMDGFEASRKIRQQQHLIDLPIIAMTADALTGSKEKCIASGMNDYISKPFSIAELNAVLQKWVKQYSSSLDKKIRSDSSNKGASTHLSLRTKKLTTESVLSIDTVKALKRFNSEELYFKTLQLFKTNQHDVVKQLSCAINTNEHKDAQMLLHTLKGILPQIGAEKLYEIVLLMEANNRYAVDFSNMMPLFKSEIEQVFSDISQLCSTQKVTGIDDQNNKRIEEKIKPATETYKHLILKLHYAIKEFDTEAIVILEDLRTRVTNTPENKHLQKTAFYLEQFNYEDADRYLLKHLLKSGE